MESKERALPLLLTALEVRKAFNVVDHEILKFRLLQAIPDLALWNVTVEQLTSSEAKVRINGQFGLATPIRQGVGQGRILSPLEYKIYINPLLKDLRKLSVGTYLGPINACSPTCADVIILAGKSPQQTQLVLVTGQPQ